ncbi:tetratricopeptide repeat protein [Halospina denitrificans]|uniref:Tetratricopeptide repeat protein n=1 Tax=Halospina denitrificans TaxID=332522 RepID=A0A4R7JLD6_9GAMM|nr:tetratricopeptide repeat protein [Halospina denitrificans]TDT38454.1 tetratricopeptide repeat protein [Halospina denitrificans]
MRKHQCALLPVLGLTFLMVGCSGLMTEPSKPSDTDDKPATEEDKSTEDKVAEATLDEEEISYRDFPPDVLFALLSAELAAQRGRFDVTLVNYTQAAADTGDEGVIRRAMQIAQALNATNAQRQIAAIWLKANPDAPQALRIAALRALQNDEFEQAIQYMERLYTQGEVAQFDTLATQARAMKPEQQQELLRLYREVHDRHPDQPDVTYSLALLNDNAGNTEESLSLVNGILESHDNFQPAITLKGKLLYDLERNEEAINYLRRQTRRFPDNRRLGTLYARILVNAGRLQAAEDEFQSLMERFPEASSLKLSRALVALENDNNRVARTLLQELVAEGLHTNEAHFYLGRLADDKNNANEALHHYRQVQGGSHFFSALSRASFLEAKQGELDSVRNKLENLRARLPEQRERLWLLEINLLLDLGEHDEALTVADSALSEHPENSDIRYARAMLHERAGQIEAMEADLRGVLEQEPNNAVALNALGYTLTVHTERYGEARQLIMKALEIQPENPAILDSAGWVHYHLGENQKALDYLKQAYDILPDVEIAAHLGRVLWAMDKKDDARMIWRRALDENEEQQLTPLLEILDELGLSAEDF